MDPQILRKRNDFADEVAAGRQNRSLRTQRYPWMGSLGEYLAVWVILGFNTIGVGSFLMSLALYIYVCLSSFLLTSNFSVSARTQRFCWKQGHREHRLSDFLLWALHSVPLWKLFTPGPETFNESISSQLFRK